ncbi:MAG: beta-aspartyl-peptidase [Lysobacterales bacterium CG17_big_fil_post_rev_8_21_14_2_50_64_11]|nr:MAG: beta-aspartyl-peptidase [Xanthomonadales bacterium CG17_big_fil_post_rev_8_21_14_2_50_64_11]
MHESPPLMLIRAATVFCPAPIGVADILLGGGRILAIQPDLPIATLALPVKIIDGLGLWACPGLVDGLVHVSGGGGEGGFASRTPALNPGDAIAAGITSIIGALGTDDITRSHADLLAATRSLQASGITGYALTGSYHVPVTTLTGSVRADLTLIPDIIGVGELAIADHRGSQPEAHELARIAAEARVGGMLAGKAGTVLIHVGDGDEHLRLLHAVCDAHEVPIRQWQPTHINRSQGLLSAALAWTRRGGSIDLTTSTTAALTASGDVVAAQALHWLFANGVPLAQISMSSDGQASLPHFDAEGELLDLEVARVGSLLETVRSAVIELHCAFADTITTVTRSPAEIWGLRSKGQLRVGADADVLLLDPAQIEPVALIAGGRLHLLRQ